MKIILAKKENSEEIAILHKGTISNINSKDYSKKQINARLEKTTTERFYNSFEKCKRWVVVKDNNIFGFCDHGFDCELWGLYVHKDYIGKGIGSKLLEVLENSLKEKGCKKITIKSTITAKNFYLKYGYKIIKEDFHPVNDEKLEIFVMEKLI